MRPISGSQHALSSFIVSIIAAIASIGFQPSALVQAEPPLTINRQIAALYYDAERLSNKAEYAKELEKRAELVALLRTRYGKGHYSS
jgi:hypothetical protein